jgi:hypothetical protein
VSTQPTTKRERLLAARAERQRIAEENRAKQKRSKQIRLAIFALVAVGLIAVVGYWVSQTAFAPQLGVAYASEGRDHVSPGTPLNYKNNPPSSGPHYPTWARPGVYPDPVDPGLWVHSLEHGYIVVLYNCPNGCPELVQQLRQFYESAPPSKRYGYQKLVVTPYPQLEGRLAAVAWGRVYQLPDFDANELSRFYQTYVDKGPEDAS